MEPVLAEQPPESEPADSESGRVAVAEAEYYSLQTAGQVLGPRSCLS